MYIYEINIPMHNTGLPNSESYEEEMSDAKSFGLTENEYHFLRSPKGLFDLFDSKYGTIIDEGEEDRIEKINLEEALKDTKSFINKNINDIEYSALTKVISSLELAIHVGSFWEIDIYWVP